MSEIVDVEYETAHLGPSPLSSTELKSIRSLFCAVIEQAFIDMREPQAFNGEARAILATCQRTAAIWLLKMNADLMHICGICPVTTALR
jgi:hypothetical protein